MFLDPPLEASNIDGRGGNKSVIEMPMRAGAKPRGGGGQKPLFIKDEKCVTNKRVSYLIRLDGIIKHYDFTKVIAYLFAS